MRVAPGKIDQIGSESHHNDPKTTLSRANKFRGPYSVGSFARGSEVKEFVDRSKMSRPKVIRYRKIPLFSAASLPHIGSPVDPSPPFR
jgi:hypothetical protein